MPFTRRPFHVRWRGSPATLHLRPRSVLLSRCRIPMPAYPHLLAPLDLGFTTLQESRADGFDARRPRGVVARFPQVAAFYAERATGGVGLIVTGGISPNRAGRVEPRARRDDRLAGGTTIAWSPMPCTRRVERICDANTAFGRYSYHSHWWHRRRIKSPITPFRPHALQRSGESQKRSTISSAAPRSRSDAGYDGVEIMGSEGYLHQPVRRAAHQSSRRRMGRIVSRTGCGFRSRSSSHARSGRARTSS